jgi:hypothetical protein
MVKFAFVNGIKYVIFYSVLLCNVWLLPPYFNVTENVHGIPLSIHSLR